MPRWRCERLRATIKAADAKLAEAEKAHAALKLADYMVPHRDKVKIVGTSPQATDRKTQDEVNALAYALNANAPRMSEAQRRPRVILQGS